MLPSRLAILLYLLPIAGLAVIGCLVVRQKSKFHDLSRNVDNMKQLVESALALTDRLSALEGRLSNFEDERRAHSQWVAQAESLHLNRRGQVLRLYQRGDSVPEIASALRLGQGEIRLMIKVHEMKRKAAQLPGQVS